MAENTNSNAPAQAPAAQTPAQPTPTAQNAQPQNAPNYDNFFTKLDSILDKRSEGLAKSALKDNGVDESEIKEIVTAWKTNRQTKADESATALNAAQQEIAALKAQAAQLAISTVAQAQAAKMGIDADSLPYVTKLADFGDVLNDKGEPDVEKINAALQTVIDNVPAFKKTAAEQKGFVKVGGDGGKDETESEAEAKLRRAFGLAPKKQ